MSDHRAGLDQDNDHPNFAPSRRELLSTLGLGLLAAPAIAGWAAPTTAHALDVGARLPPFTLPDLQGRNYQSRALRGKVAFIDIWASWCGPCAEEFPVLNRLHQQYSARGLEIVAISVDSEVAAIRRFLRRIPAQFRILHDAGRAYVQELAPPRMPSSYIVDRRGIVRFVHGGFRAGDARAYDREVRQLLG